ncbi:MAG: hypothetical protein LUE98_01405 [Tannerellaceae bacterium]|nr:hypothetical protein [Tannerellaceae bacterium]
MNGNMIDVKKIILLVITVGFASTPVMSQKNKFDYSLIAVPEEGGANFLKITSDDDRVAAPYVKEAALSLGKLTKAVMDWWINPMIALSPDGAKLAYINDKNKMQNIMVKNAAEGGVSVQRTFRSNITDFTWSEDGSTLCFTELRNNKFGVYLVNAQEGAVVQQISTSNESDFAGVLSPDGNIIYFHRGEGYSNYSLWSFDRETKLFSNYSRGMTPCLIPGEEHAFYCTRYTDKKECEIWKVNYETGVEEIILAQEGRSFTSPRLSPDGQWLLVTGNSISERGKKQNTDLFVIRTDGTDFTQLTYHPGNDISGIWSADGKSIYFLSQRGSAQRKYNVWKMDFNL